MKKILAMAAVAALAAGASAYAANPFSDVSTSDWAYQAISDLSDRGMIEGYPDGTFKGQQNITRFEMAQIIARLMAKEDQMDAEHRAIVDRLASEYGAELRNLGVRVGNLEKKVGNIVWSGDGRMLYGKTLGGADEFSGRIQIEAHATVNDSTYVHGRLLGEANLKDPDSDDGKVSMDRLYVHHQFGKVGATLGRYEVDMGQQLGGWLYANTFDGIELAAPLSENLDLSVGYGRMKDAAESTDVSVTFDDEDYDGIFANNFSKAEIFYAQLKADLKVAKVGIDFFKAAPYTVKAGYKIDETNKYIFEKGQKKTVWGVNVLVPVNDFRIFGDYYADTQNSQAYSWAYGKDQKGKIWTVGLGYGEMDLEKPGSFAADLAYFKVKAGLYEDGMTGSDMASLSRLFMENGHFWLASANVALAKNTYLHGEYAFGSKLDEDVHSNDYANCWTLSLNYIF